MLKISNFTKKYGDKIAVKNLSLEVKDGELVCLIGPNGSGKTTLIKTIVGLTQPTEGSVLVNGFNVVTEPMKSKAVVGYIPDEPTVWAGITGEEFLHFVGAMFGVKREERNEKISKLLDIFGLKGMESEYFEDYSRGGKQKFAILSAMLHDPKFMLIDEPLVGLDPDSAEIAKHLFSDLAKKQKRGVLLVTHTLEVAQEIADRIGLLYKGELVAIGTMPELRKKASLPETASLLDIYHKFTGNKDLMTKIDQ
jgi:ABC-2 type transport system ATP-binding protein